MKPTITINRLEDGRKFDVAVLRVCTVINFGEFGQDETIKVVKFISVFTKLNEFYSL